MTNVIGHDLVRLAKTHSDPEVIHRASCRYAQTDRVPWIWAEGEPVSSWPEWFRPCKACRPDLAPPGREREQC